MNMKEELNDACDVILMPASKHAPNKIVKGLKVWACKNKARMKHTGRLGKVSENLHSVRDGPENSTKTRQR